MNERQLRDQLQSFADPIRFSPRPPKRRFNPRLATIATVFVVGCTLLLAPRPSPAVAAMGRMEVALQGVRSMEATVSQVSANGQLKPAIRFWYQGNAWRVQSRIGTPLELTFLIKNGIVYRFDRKHQVVTHEPYEGWLGDLSSPMSFAQEQTNFGRMSPRSSRVEDRLLSDGRAGTAVILEREEDAYHCEILVDRATGLPVRSDTSFIWTNATRTEQDRTVISYRFNQKVGDDLFDPDAFDAPLLDSIQVGQDFLSRYRTPAKKILNTEIHEAEATPDGTIQVVVSVAPRRSPTPLELTTDSGVKYVASNRLHPAGSWGDTHVPEFAATSEREYLVLTYVPVRPTPEPESITLTAQNGKSITVRTKPIESDRPWFASGLLMNQAFDAGKIRNAEAVADWYRDQKQYETELTWRWKAHAAAVAYVRRFGELEVPALVDCLRRLGRNEEAERVQRELGPQPIKRYP